MAFIDPDDLPAAQASAFRDPDEIPKFVDPDEVQGQTPSVGGVVADLVKQPLYAMRGMNVAARQMLGDVLGSERMQKSAQDEAAEMAYQQKAYSPKFEGEIAQGLYGGVQSAARQAPAVALGIASGGAAAPLAMLGADTGGQAYTKYRGRGATPGMAAVGGLGEAATEIGTELLPMGFLVKKFGKVGAGQFLSGLLAREIPSEQVATAVQDAIDTAIANPTKTWDEYLAERFPAAKQTLLATIGQAGVMAGASKVGQRFMKKPTTDTEKIEEGLDQIDLKTADHQEALKTQSQNVIYVGEDQVASDSLGTKITEPQEVVDYARAQVQDRLATQDPEKFSRWEPNQQELFAPLSGPHFPDAKAAGQQDLGIQTSPEGIPPEAPLGRKPGAVTYNEGDVGVTPVESTPASDAQAQMLWHEHQAKVARNKGDEDLARTHETKRDQARKLYEQASKEYGDPGSASASTEIPKWLNQIEAKGEHLTEDDLRSALAKRIARDPKAYTKAQQMMMMENPSAHITKAEAQKELLMQGPGSPVRYNVMDLPSYDKATGMFDGMELLQMILDDKSFRGYTQVIKYIMTHLKRHAEGGIPLKWAVSLNEDGTFKDTTTFRRGSDTTKWDRDYAAAHYDGYNHLVEFGAEGLTARTVIHEALHALTVRFIENNPKHSAVKALQFIFDSVKKDPVFHVATGKPNKEGKIEQEYGLTNLKEFISEAFSHPRFQMKLLGHKVSGLASTARDALSLISDQVRKILGIPDKSATNTLEELIRRVDDVAEIQSTYGKELEDWAKSYYTPVELPKPTLYSQKMDDRQALRDAEKARLKALGKLVNIPNKQVSTEIEDRAQGGNRSPIDADDARSRVTEKVTGLEYVAKDPVIDDAAIEAMAKEPDGSDLWGITPGGLARAIDTQSSLVMTGYRLLDNAKKRTDALTKKIVTPAEKAVVKLLHSGEKGIILSKLLMRELKNKRDYSADELRQAGVPDDVIMAHLEFRTMMEGILERMNQALADKNLPPVDRLTAYIASRWTGPWRANIRDADGKIVWQIAEHSKGKAKKALEYIMSREKGLVADDIAYHEGKERGESVESSYLNMLNLLDPEDPRVKTLQSIHEEYILGKTEDIAAQEKHFLKKTGVRGFAGDRPWAKNDAEDMFVQQFEYAKNGLKWAEYQKAVDKLRPLLHDPRLQESQKNNIAYLKEYSKNHLGFGTMELFNKLDNAVAKALGVSPASLQSGMGAAKTYFYLSRLGLSIPFTIAQFIQPAITNPAWNSELSARGYWHNPIVTTVQGTLVGIEAATWHYMKLLGNDPTMVESLMDSVDKDAARWMEANGIVEINQLADIKRDLRPKSVKTLAMPFEFTIKHSEVIARSIAFMSYVQHLKQSNAFDLDTAKGRAELFQLAEDMTKVSMTDYRSTERAMIFERGGLVGDAAATLHSYQLNNLFQLWHFGKQFARGNKTPFVNMMFMQLTAAGVLGLWFIDDLDDLWDNFKKLLPHDEYQKVKNLSIKNFMLENAPDVLSYGGVSKLTGTNIHTRMSAADQLPIMPFEQMDLSSVKGIGQSVANMAGSLIPFAGTAGNAVAAGVTAASNAPDRRKWEAAYAAAPAVAQGPMERLPAFNRGATSKNPNRIEMGFRKRTEEEKDLRDLGFRSIPEQKQKDKEYMNSKVEMEIARRLQNASQKATDHFLDGNTKKGVTEVVKYVDLGGDPAAVLNRLPKTKIQEMTTEVQRRTLDASSGSRAALLKLKRYLDNVGVQ